MNNFNYIDITYLANPEFIAKKLKEDGFKISVLNNHTIVSENLSITFVNDENQSYAEILGWPLTVDFKSSMSLS